MRRLAITTLIASAAFGQADPKNTERMFTLVHADTLQSQHELATVIRAEFEINDVRLDTDHRTLTIVGSPAQIAGTEWLLGELDKPAATADAQPHASAIYQMDAGAEGTIRVFYMNGARTVQELQESATAIRSTTEIRRLFTYNATRAIVVRGAPAQIETAEWLWSALDTTAAVAEFKTKIAGPENVLHVYRLPASGKVRELQEAATLIRAIVEVRRMFTYNRTRTMVVRATPEQMAAVDWLFAEMAKPATAMAAVSGTYRMDDPHGEGVLRLFRMSAGFTPARLQSVAASVRGETRVRRLFTYNSPPLIAVRGTEAQLAEAEHLIAGAK